jgi:hypothetical protein
MIIQIQKRVPLMALQKAIYELLSVGQTTPVYDDVPENAKLPYITLGAFTCKQNGAKGKSIWDVSLQIRSWSDYSGKREINEILNDISTVISSVKLDLSGESFEVMSQEIDFIEAFPEEFHGYHGVATLVCRIQDKK